MDFTAAIKTLKKHLPLKLDLKQYDCFIVKKLPDLSDRNISKPTVKITDGQINLFPYLDKTEISIFKLEIPLTIYKENMEHLTCYKALSELDINNLNFNEDGSLSFSANVMKNTDVNLDTEAPYSTLYLAENDSNLQKVLINIIKEDNYLVILKVKGQLQYDILIFNKEDNELDALIGNFYVDSDQKTCYPLNLNKLIKSIDVGEETILNLDNLRTLLDETYLNSTEETRLASIYKTILEYGPLIQKKQLDIKRYH